ncbi:hypothetical protein Tco_0545211 [Tanacetum coccineum]
MNLRTIRSKSSSKWHCLTLHLKSLLLLVEQPPLPYGGATSSDDISLDHNKFKSEYITVKYVPVEKANEVLVTKGSLQSGFGHLDMLDHEVGRLCNDYAWWKLTRRCWNTHVLAAAAIGTKGEMWSLIPTRNGTRT